MLVQNQYVEVAMSGKTIFHYRELGYEVKDVTTKLTVPVEHLTKGSHVKVDLICDCCGKPFKREYKTYLQCTNDKIDYCEECGKTIKSKQTIKEKYGVDNAIKIPGVKEKMKQTCFERYGVEHYSQTDECKKKVEQTCMEKYGAKTFLSLPNVRERINSTVKEKYGVDNIRQLESVKEKTRKTNLERYGVEVPILSPIVREKMNNTFIKNHSIPTSSQQIYIYDLLKTKYQNIEKNYLCDNSFFDVALFINDIRIDIEYDGWYWHQDKQKDRRRDEYFKSQGWKILRIRSGHLLPTEEQLFEAIEELVTTDRKFKEIILDDWKEGEESA